MPIGVDTVHQQIIMRRPTLKYLLASNLCIRRETPPDRTPPIIRRQRSVFLKPDTKIRLSSMSVNLSTRKEGTGMRRTFDVKYRPKTTSSPRSSACLTALSRENPPAEINSLPAQIARWKSFDSLSTARSIEPRTRDSSHQRRGGVVLILVNKCAYLWK
jgi:hypothetical protein